MCMKNVNLNGVFCDIIPSKVKNAISLGNIEQKAIFSTNSVDGKISQMSMTIFVSATETKDPLKLVVDPNNVFSFQQRYEVRVRLTEVSTGDFKDVGGFILDPIKNGEEKGYCRKVFNQIQLCIFENIDLPKYKEGEHFVVKLLIRAYDEENSEKFVWNVQAIYPIQINRLDNMI